MTVSRKIALISAASVALSTVVAVLVQGMAIRTQGIELTHNTMRAAVIAAENMRASVSSLRAKSAFNVAAMTEIAKSQADFRQTTLYDTVPVVSAWRAIEKVARQEGFEFRIPKVHPRNPANEPTPTEAEILSILEKSGKEEYFLADRKANLIVYARPIRLTADCLSCHGDPATSPTHNGKDILGFPMEGWHEGELHGAFVLTAHMDQVDKVASAKAQSAAIQTTLLWMLPAGVLIALSFTWYSRRSIVRPLFHIIDSVRTASQETSAASRQIAAGSQDLAQSATEQAASLDNINEVLSSVTAMVRGASEGATRARSLADETAAAAGRGSEDMKRMEEAMGEIQQAARDVSKIVKSIDEVAFQTNILALNAAVEAARAGEAGAGFAVVADEVRNLAQRSAQSARETAALVGDAIDRSVKGSAICREVVGRLQEIEDCEKPLHEAVARIASAAADQRSHIEQVGKSVAELHQVTQGVAANAEESAAASTELNAQSDGLASAIEDLCTLIGAR